MNPTISAIASPDDTAPQQSDAPQEIGGPVETVRNRSVVTRFGELVIDDDKIITFPEGLYGFEQHHRYILTKVPDWPDVFKLLQAVDDPHLSLIVLPLEGVGGPIDRTDFAEGCRMLGFSEQATTVLGIVTMRSQTDNQIFTVNLKAPLLIDTERRQGRQHVFASEKYQMRHPLPLHENQEG